MFKPIACAADMESHDKRKNTTATSRNYSFQSTLPALTCRHASRSIARGVAFLSVCSQTWCFHFIYLATSTQKASRKYNEMDSSRKRNEDGCASTKKMAHLNKLIQSQCYKCVVVYMKPDSCGEDGTLSIFFVCRGTVFIIILNQQNCDW